MSASDDRTQISAVTPAPAADPPAAPEPPPAPVPEPNADATMISNRPPPPLAPPSGETSAAPRTQASPFAATAAPARDPARQTTVEIGEVLGHTYRIEEFLAKGGMGAVYRARHTILDSVHAIKIILAQFAQDPQVVALLSQEAKALSKVKSDAVVEYQGLFLDEHGRRYLVMEFADGPSLARVLQDRSFSPAEVRQLRDRLALGLAVAHDKGVFHRDISPDNVILPGGRIENAKIIDFGIAKHADTGEKTIIGGDFAGKYSFASPEQAGMFGGKVDARADIYSLGLVLAACAIGHGEKLAMGDSPASVFRARESVPDLSAVPPELRDELAKMLQPKPEDRPQRMEDIVTRRPAVERSMGAAPPSAARGSGVGRAIGAGVAVLVALLGLVGVVQYVYPEFLLSQFGASTAALQAQLQGQLAGLHCSQVSAEITQDYLFRLKVRLDGVVESQTDAGRAIDMARLGRQADVVAPLQVLPWPLCEAASLVGAMAQTTDPAARPVLQSNQPNFLFHDGDQIVLTVTQSPRFDGFLYVDYVDPDGSVLHMLPAPRQPDNAANAGDTITVGEAASETNSKGQVFKISPPFGTQIIVALATKRPLFAAPRPRSEPAADYFAALRKALDAQAQDGSDATSSYALLQTLPKG